MVSWFHLYGLSADMDKIMEICSRYNVTVIEDAAESLGAYYKGKHTGTFGEFGVFSFNGNKIITTSGGGALTLKNIDYKKKAVFLSTQAKDDAPHYEHTSIGYNYRMSNICAGIGRGQMEVLEERIAQRRANHQFYKEILEHHPTIKLHREPNNDYFSNHWLSVIIISEESAISRDEISALFSEENIETRPIWKPMHLQPIFKDHPYFGADKIAEELFRNGLCLPSGSNLTHEDRDRIAQVLLKTFPQ